MHETGDESTLPPNKPAPGQEPRAGRGLAGRRPPRRRWRLFRRRPAPVPASTKMLPVLIKVFAGFSKVDGVVEESEIDSSLSALRHDFPETVYSELRRLYREAIEESVDLNGIAKELADELADDDKLLLGAQLYALISQSGNLKEHLIPFYLFMTNLGVASEAIDLVYQLNTGELGARPQPKEEPAEPLESLHVGRGQPADLVLATLPEGYEMMAFRFERLVLVKNSGQRPFVARGRHVPPGGFTQLYAGQRILLAETVLSYGDLVNYFNAKNNVATTRVFLSFRWDGNAYVEKARTKDSHLEIEFGLGVEVSALRDTDAVLAGRLLKRGYKAEAALTDRIVLANGTEISLSELRRRARELGGRFELHPSKFVYAVSTDPAKLDAGDILLSPGSGGDVTLQIRCDFEAKTGALQVVESDQPIHVGDHQVRGKTDLRNGDVIRIGETQYLSCDFGERIIEEQRNLVSGLEVADLTHSYDGKENALDGVSLSARRGELICIIGPSGCGKTTLIRALAGHEQPDQGKVLINGFSLYRNLPNIGPYISYIPQEEAFDPLLTVEENIDCAAAIRCPHLSPAERRKRADSRLVELGLSERRHRLAGDANNKYLSGGERKRLNAGLDMISIAEVYLFDEPTSGLSSKDSEHVMEIIRGLSQNKITFVSIHQPSSRLFHMFHKALLLDKGGKVAFFGTPAEMLDYFRGAQAEGSPQAPAAEPEPEPGGAGGAALQPDFIFDVLETPLRDLSGNIVYEEDSRGHYIPARRFLPDYWADRFQAHRLMQEVRESRLEPADGEAAAERPLPTPPKRGVEGAALHLATHIKRSFLSKLRNRANLATTLLEAPALALLIATVLRYSEEGQYTFASAFHIPTYLFLTLVVALFLGLTNSADEIIRDRPMLARERGHGIRVWHYIAGKFLSLAVFALVQCVIYITVGNAVLGIRDMFWTYLGWMFLTSLTGAAIGLFISSVVRDSKTALNAIPLVLIPQIILGGALIKYEEMNRNLDFVFRVRKWLAKDESGQPEKPSELKVPIICEIMPLRWSYESMVIAQDKRNPLARTVAEIEEEKEALLALPDADGDGMSDLDGAQLERLNDLKDAQAMVFGLEDESYRGVRGRLAKIRRDLRDGNFDPDDFPEPRGSDTVSSIDLYQNQKIRDLVAKAEMETEDYRLYEEDASRRRPNVFFGQRKTYLGNETDTLGANRIAMFGFIAAALCALAASLRWQLRKV